ncbi:hypothetical protein BHAOGJBA_1006 [Methylobacterium hispanicum]|jgi:small subunit ribosomal protein S6|uniref:Small ribosomal subunit protein bS6 n=2 Tax=Methylobacterium TaxID=407 RepID=A0AAV4ZGJ6_9HYPH|nr:hypothetical protein BHAOGJBA_1006 [Methylobacterium hispanicum]
MAIYEHLFLARQDVTSQQVETMIDTYKGVIEQNGGRLEKIEMWGVKSLAYRIKKNRKAHFALLNIDAPPAAIAEMERQMQISEDILRFMTIRVEELEAEPPVLTQRQGGGHKERPLRRGDEFAGSVHGAVAHGPDPTAYGLYGLPADEGHDAILETQYDLILSQLRILNEEIEERLGGRINDERGSVRRDKEWNIDTGGDESPQGQYKENS